MMRSHCHVLCCFVEETSIDIIKDDGNKKAPSKEDDDEKEKDEKNVRHF